MAPTNSQTEQVQAAKLIDADTLEIEETDEKQLGDLIDEDFAPPIKPVPEFKTKVTGKQSVYYRYYLSVLPRLPEWWDEFNTALDKSALPLYKNAFQFARAKGTNQQERDLLFEMIGPLPDRKTLRVPWLGDWKKKRSAGFCTPTLNNNIKQLAAVCRDKLDTIEAIKSTAPYLVHELGQYSKLTEQINEAFNGVMFLPNLPPNAYENMARAKAFIVLHKSITRMKLELMDKWCLIHGMDVKNPHEYLQVNQQINIAQGGTQHIDAKEVETVRLARMLQSHAESFGLPLPAEKKHQVIEAEPTKANGKAKLQ
jgi:hypothetical protein